MKRAIHSLSLLGIILCLSGCVVSVGSRIQASGPAVPTDDADRATIAEIDAAARLSGDTRRVQALAQIAQRPALSLSVQLHLVNVIYRNLSFDNNKTYLLAMLIDRPDFSDTVRHAIVSQLNQLSFDSNRQYILGQINARQQQVRQPALASAPVASSSSSAGPAPNTSASPAPSPATSPASVPHTNTAIIPEPRGDDRSRARTDVVLKRAKDNPGECDLAFIGDSITQGWEGAAGRTVWTNFYGNRKCLNFGVGGDRTQHVLWRFEHGQLDGIKPKVAVLLIGTNNSGRDNTEADILEGVQAIVKQIRERLPETKILVLGIFPRARNFTAQRGQILQVNQALAKVADGKMIYYVDFGSQLIEPDGSISTAVMPDALHLSERGYAIWAEAIEPKLKELLAN